MTVITRAHETRQNTIVRSLELDRLTHLVQAARDRYGLVAELTGDPGSGKTWLLTALTRQARRDGVTVLYGRCAEAETELPFHPFIHALGTWRGAGGRIVPPAAALMDALGGADGTDTMSFNRRHQFFVTVRRTLADCLAAAPGEVLLVLDDFHWADPSSLGLLEMLVRRPMDGKLAVVVARRPRQSPVRLRSVLELGAVESIELGPLSPGQSARLLDGLVAEPGTLRRLHERAAGNPLYLTTLATPGPADDNTALWTRGSIGARLLMETELLAKEARAVLNAAAVLGDTFDVEAAAAVAAIDRDVACRVLVELRQRDLIRPAAGDPGTLTFRHPLVRHALYAAIDSCWRAAAHRRAMAHLAGIATSSTELAWHAERSGAEMRPSDGVVLAAAAHDALRLGRPAEAAHWVSAALRLHRATAGPAAQEPGPELWRPVVRALAATADATRIRALGREVLRREVLGGRVAGGRAEEVAFLATVLAALGDGGEAQALIKAELTGVHDPAARALLHVQAQLAKVLSGEVPARADVEALARHSGQEDPVTSAGRLALLGMCAIIAGNACEAEEPLRAAARILDTDQARGPAGPQQAGYLLALGWAEALMGWYEQGRAHTERALSGARERGDLHLMAPLLATLGYAHYHLGQLADAQTAALEARSAAHRIGRGDHVGLADAVIAASWARLGRPTLTHPQYVPAQASEEIASRTPLNALLFAEAALAAGEAFRALALLLPHEHVWQVPEPVPVYAAWCYELLAAACLRADSGDSGRIDRWAEAAVEAAVAVGLPEAGGHALLARGHAFSRQQQWEQAARCYAQALGLFGEGSPAAARARELVRAATRSAAHGLPGLDELTMREREVAHLAGEGLKTKDIAERLRISPRTVDVHLTRIYAKLGVSSRAALARLLAGAT
ncbi:helix-turn-helix transcriptional regulator [Acrocarpospora catenulata]|uniref:helix-turn-helix transcriptional regulator n=1 Tax=Acrocarpospora catenulata TaxID=2836182 RepID=UPI001BDA6132|nr:AAA family ATPase [Acrocarpospora catenulata]